MSATLPIPAAVVRPRDRVAYPRNQVVGIIDSPENARGILFSLRHGRFLDSEIHLVAGDDAADSLHASTGHFGLAGWLIRAATWLGVRDDEMELKDHYEHALRHGALLVAIEVPTNARRQLAVEILARHGAHTVNYFGRFVQVEYAKAR
jgi:hypothetical protein